MGLFDEIRCLYPLPIEVPPWVDWFQTKDLENLMSRFEITADGRLIELPSDPADLFHHEPGDWSDYHADLRFYTSNLVAKDHNGLWIADKKGDHYESFEFAARFTDGKLTRIKLIQHETMPARTRVTPPQTD